MIKIYGIKTCDTCRKALNWLDDEEIGYQWIDLRTGGLSGEQIEALVFADEAGYVSAINKSSKTWREMSALDKECLGSDDPVVKTAILKVNPLVIKRPFIDHSGNQGIGEADDLTCGFTPEVKHKILAQLKKSKK